MYVADCRKYEEIAVNHAHEVAFVLVAGGLGERLGYGGIKVSLPSELTTGKCYLQVCLLSLRTLFMDEVFATLRSRMIHIPLKNLICGVLASESQHGCIALSFSYVENSATTRLNMFRIPFTGRKSLAMKL